MLMLVNVDPAGRVLSGSWRGWSSGSARPIGAAMLVMAAAVFGTFLTTFAVTLNNHLIAAVSALAAIYPAVRIWFDGERRWRYFALAGFFAAFTATNDLPALSLFAALSVGPAVEGAAADAAAYLPAAAGRGRRLLRHELDRPPHASAYPHAP